MSEEQVEQAAETIAEHEVVPETVWQRRMRIVKQHLWGPTGSIILHILVVIALFTLVTTVQKTDQPDIQVTMVDPVTEDLEQFKKELEEIKPVQEQDMITPPDAPVVDQPPDVPTDSPVSPEIDMTALDIKADVSSPMVLRGFFAGRTADGRNRMLGRYAGKYGGPAEAAINKALRWLRDHQKPDGSWNGSGGAANAPAMTGLALLTFLAHGETTNSKEFGPTVEKAIRWLLQKQNGSNGEFDGNSYANGIAVYAISEGYALCRIPEMREAMEKGAARIVKGMQPSGGFNYGYAQDGRRDTSVAGWQAQALKAAKIAGAEIENLDAVLEKVVSGMKSNYNSSAMKFGYAPPGDGQVSDNMTAIGVLALQLLGHGEDKEATDGVKSLSTMACDWRSAPDRALYGWYYATQAKFQAGKSTFDPWNNQFAPMLIGNQNEDGSWVSPGGAEKPYGPVYGTTLSALTLMVYYRNLPTYQKIDVPEAKPETDPTAEIEIDIS